MVPVLFIPYALELLEALFDFKDVTIVAGPNVQAFTPPNFTISEGSVRVYDTLTNQWTHHKGIFGSVNWMEHSHVRDVLFVCTSANEVLALDTSNPVMSLPVIGTVEDVPACHTAPVFRDYHTVDVHQGDQFFTVLVDPAKHSNKLYCYLTTDIRKWNLLSVIDANWENDFGGMGQVVATPDGTRLIITWHCSTVFCSGAKAGERLYVLDLAYLPSRITPPLLGIVQLPMSQGSLVRDVTCNVDSICLVSLTWDGIVAVDLADGPNRLRVIAEHSPTFRGPTVPERISHARMVSGAQKVVPSATKPMRFYVERWNLNATRLRDGATLGRSFESDSVWVVVLEGYHRPAPASDVPLAADPPVQVILTLRMTMQALLKSVPGGSIDDLERAVALGIQDALGVGSDRVVVTGAKSTDDGQEALVFFSIVDGPGKSPMNLYGLLRQQMETQGSAIYTGPLALFIEGAQVHIQGTTGLTDSFAGTVVHDTEKGFGFYVTLLLMLMGIAIIFAVWAIVFAWRSRRTADLAMSHAAAIEQGAAAVSGYQQQQQPGGAPPVAPMPFTLSTPNSGYLIGRPTDSQPSDSGAGGAAGPPSAGSVYVVGTPVADGGTGAAAAGASATAAGAALSDIDREKLA